MCTSDEFEFETPGLEGPVEKCGFTRPEKNWLLSFVHFCDQFKKATLSKN
jgi:hypothetical protein